MVGPRALVIGNLKRCNKCNEWKAFDAFQQGRAFCKVCQNAYNTAYRKANPGKLKEYSGRHKEKNAARQKRFRETVEGKAKALFRAAVQRSKQANLECDLTWQIVFALLHLQEFKCAQTDIAFTFSVVGTHRKLRKLTAPSIDRKNNARGYTLDNIQIVCWFYNAAKGTSSDDEVWQLFNSMRQRVK
jgi:hypothetical protein